MIFLEPHTHWLQSSTESRFHVTLCMCQYTSQRLTTALLQSQGLARSHHIFLHLSRTGFLFIQIPKTLTGNPPVSCYRFTFVWQFPTYHLHLNLYSNSSSKRATRIPTPTFKQKTGFWVCVVGNLYARCVSGPMYIYMSLCFLLISAWEPWAPGVLKKKKVCNIVCRTDGHGM